MPDADPHGIEVHPLDILNDDEHFPNAYAHKGAREYARRLGILLLNVRHFVGASGQRSRGDLHMIVQDDVNEYAANWYAKNSPEDVSARVREERQSLLSWYYNDKRLSDLDPKTVRSEEKEEKEEKETPDLSDVEDVSGQRTEDASRFNLEDHAESGRPERERTDVQEASETDPSELTLWEWDDVVARIRVRVDQVLEETGGEVDEAVQTVLETESALEEKLEEKVENFGHFLEFCLDRKEEFEGRADFHRRRMNAAKEKVQAIEDRVEDMEKAADGLKKYVRRFMVQHDLDELEGGEYRFRLVGKGGRPPLEFDRIPDVYLRHEVRVKWIPSDLSSMDRVEIEQAIDTLRDVCGNSNVTIKTKPDKRWLKDRLDEGDDDVSEHVAYVDRPPKLKVDGSPT